MRCWTTHLSETLGNYYASDLFFISCFYHEDCYNAEDRKFSRRNLKVVNSVNYESRWVLAYLHNYHNFPLLYCLCWSCFIYYFYFICSRSRYTDDVIIIILVNDGRTWWTNQAHYADVRKIESYIVSFLKN